MSSRARTHTAEVFVCPEDPEPGHIVLLLHHLLSIPESERPFHDPSSPQVDLVCLSILSCGLTP